MDKKRTVHEVAFRLSHDIALQITPRAGEVGIGTTKTQMRALRMVWSRDNVTAMEIAKTIKRDKAQVTRLIDELVKSGLVERKPNPSDRRSKILSLTQKATEHFERIEEVEAEFSHKLVQGIDEQDLATFYKVADQLSDNLAHIDADK